MKALSLGLIKGSLDQVEQVVHVDWVQPRVLNRSQIGGLRNHLNVWSERVGKLVQDMQAAV
jgi:26S proteasome regulatory subunit N9